jgi:hypothetical protein
MLARLAALALLALARGDGGARTLDTLHRFEPPATLAAWEERAGLLRTQVLLAAGLWPLPERTPLSPVIRGAVDRGDYTVEKVWFESLPGHVVSGNLYRPKGGGEARRPAVLSPHGHWADGRFCELGDQDGNDRWPLQARCAQLARLGCVVFQHDMVGYGDSTALRHGQGFEDVQALLDGASFLGLQLWNSIRALDFLCALPDVDSTRIGVTGASGGGTQTFLLCAVDPRPVAAFPAVMVSNRMQGGCVCENAPTLRLGTDNVELAALIAPRPLGLSGANDWTVAIESEGLPELKRVWALYGHEERVTARCWPELPHNYALPSRLMMYGFFEQPLGLAPGAGSSEAPLEPLTRAELAVFDDEHPRPGSEGGLEAVRAWWRGLVADRTRALPADDLEGRQARRATRKAALRALGATMPGPDETMQQEPPQRVLFAVGPDGDPEYERLVTRLGAHGHVVRIETASVTPLRDEARHARYAGYSWGYNAPGLLARAGKIHAETAGGRGLRLLAYGSEGRAAALALAVHAAEDRWPVERAMLVDPQLLDEPRELDDPGFLPGIRSLGGVAGLLALGAPLEHAEEPSLALAIVGPPDLPDQLVDAYARAGAAAHLVRRDAPGEDLLDWLAAP